MKPKIITPESELADFEKEKIMFDDLNTRKKNKLISELKMGLGEEIKKNPRKITMKKPTNLEKLKMWLRNLFTKF